MDQETAHQPDKRHYREATPEEMEDYNRQVEVAERYFDGGIIEDSQDEAEHRRPLRADTDADQPLIVDKTKCGEN